jgi:hypothetical protein
MPARFPARCGPETAAMVEAGGQNLRGFHHGLDYAFIRCAQFRAHNACGACYPARNTHEPDPSARPGRVAFGESMSL